MEEGDSSGAREARYSRESRGDREDREDRYSRGNKKSVGDGVVGLLVPHAAGCWHVFAGNAAVPHVVLSGQCGSAAATAI